MIDVKYIYKSYNRPIQRFVSNKLINVPHYVSEISKRSHYEKAILCILKQSLRVFVLIHSFPPIVILFLNITQNKRDFSCDLIQH